MPRSLECDYCGTDIEPGTGTMLVRVNGQTVYYCSGKCEKNADLGREARDLEWTESGRGAGRADEPAATPEGEPEPAAPDGAADDEDAGDEVPNADDPDEDPVDEVSEADDADVDDGEAAPEADRQDEESTTEDHSEEDDEEHEEAEA